MLSVAVGSTLLSRLSLVPPTVPPSPDVSDLLIGGVPAMSQADRYTRAASYPNGKAAAIKSVVRRD